MLDHFFLIGSVAIMAWTGHVFKGWKKTLNQLLQKYIPLLYKKVVIVFIHFISKNESLQMVASIRYKITVDNFWSFPSLEKSCLARNEHKKTVLQVDAFILKQNKTNRFNCKCILCTSPTKDCNWSHLK